MSDWLEIQKNTGFRRKSALAIAKGSLHRNDKKKIIKQLKAMGWNVDDHVEAETIHSINRRIWQYEYAEDGNQNMAIHDWQYFVNEGIHVEYSYLP